MQFRLCDNQQMRSSPEAILTYGVITNYETTINNIIFITYGVITNFETIINNIIIIFFYITITLLFTLINL